MNLSTSKNKNKNKTKTKTKTKEKSASLSCSTTTSSSSSDIHTCSDGHHHGLGLGLYHGRFRLGLFYKSLLAMAMAVLFVSLDFLALDPIQYYKSLNFNSNPNPNVNVNLNRNSKSKSKSAVSNTSYTSYTSNSTTNSTSSPQTTIPKQIYIFWDTGWRWDPQNYNYNYNYSNTNPNRGSSSSSSSSSSSAPPEAHLAKDSFELLNPDYEIIALNLPKAERLISRSLYFNDSVWNATTIQAKSDIIRTCLLYHYGGIWVDASLVNSQPLNQWLWLLSPTKNNHHDLVAFQRNVKHKFAPTNRQPNRHAKHPPIMPWVSSWFLATPPKAYTISHIYNRIINPAEAHRFVPSASNNNNNYQYFWWHQLVSELANEDAKINQTIQAFPWAEPMHCQTPHYYAQAPVLKRCANHDMAPILEISRHCCFTTTKRGDKTNTTNPLIAKEIQQLCRHHTWNCTILGDNIRLKSHWQHIHQLLLQQDNYKYKLSSSTTLSSSTSSSTSSSSSSSSSIDDILCLPARQSPKPMAPTIPTGSDRCPPNYFILGTRKGGTTSLHRYLAASHPLIYPFKITPLLDNATQQELIANAQVGESLVKVANPRQFCRQGKDCVFHTVPITNTNNTNNNTNTNTNNTNQNQIIFGDSSVFRLVTEAQPLARYCRQSRFFVLLRDPITRCHSQYLMRARLQTDNITIDSNISQAIDTAVDQFVLRLQQKAPRSFVTMPNPHPILFGNNNCLYDGAYVIHLRRLLTAGITANQLRVYFTKDLLAHETRIAVIIDALHHLGLNDSFINPDFLLSRTFNAQEEQRHQHLPNNLQLTPQLVARMRQIMAPFDVELAKLLGLDLQDLPWPVIQSDLT